MWWFTGLRWRFSASDRGQGVGVKLYRFSGLQFMDEQRLGQPLFPSRFEAKA